MATFRELIGSYEGGQRVTPAEYSDFMETMGSSMANQADGIGGPFLYNFRFRSSMVGCLGWVQSTARKRKGTWQIWGVICEGKALPATALALFWRELRNRQDLNDLLAHANALGDSLWQPAEVKRRLTALRRDVPQGPLQQQLKHYLRFVYGCRQSQALEVPISMSNLDLLPWLGIFGPVDPIKAQIQPRPFDASGYSYVLKPEGFLLPDSSINPLIKNKINEVIATADHDPGRAYADAEDVRGLLSRAVQEKLPAENRTVETHRPEPVHAASVTPPPPLLPPPTPLPAPESHQPFFQAPESTSEATAVPAAAADESPTPTASLMRRFATKTKDIATKYAGAARRITTGVLIITVAGLVSWAILRLHIAQCDLQVEVNALNARVAALEKQRRTHKPEKHAESSRVKALDAAELEGQLTASRFPELKIKSELLDALAAKTVPKEKLAIISIQIFVRLKGCISRALLVDGVISDKKTPKKCPAVVGEKLMNADGTPNVDTSLRWLEQQIAERTKPH